MCRNKRILFEYQGVLLYMYENEYGISFYELETGYLSYNINGELFRK